MRYDRKTQGMEKKNATLSTKIYANDIFLFNESRGLLLSENFVAIQ